MSESGWAVQINNDIDDNYLTLYYHPCGYNEEPTCGPYGLDPPPSDGDWYLNWLTTGYLEIQNQSDSSMVVFFMSWPDPGSGWTQYTFDASQLMAIYNGESAAPLPDGWAITDNPPT